MLILITSEPKLDSPNRGIDCDRGRRLDVVGDDVALEAAVQGEEVNSDGVLVEDVQVVSDPVVGQTARLGHSFHWENGLYRCVVQIRLIYLGAEMAIF